MKEVVKIQCPCDSGELVEMVAPVVISASRSTDIPAFYADWFMKRLEKGHVSWINPFNRKNMYVSFAKTRAIVFWTKNPAPMLPYLDELDRRGLNYYFQFTLNDYDAEGFEPKVPLVARRVETFKTLSNRLGPKRVIWRFDPILLSETITPRDILMRIWRVGNQIHGLTDRLVISFIDIAPYRKVQNNLKRDVEWGEPTNSIREPNQKEIEEIAIGLTKIRERWQSEGWNIDIQTCSELIDLSKFGISHSCCIDGELMEEVFPDDTALMEFLRPVQGDLFPSSAIPIVPVSNEAMKDQGQRKECHCVQSKDIGSYDTCAHFCVYCYANTSRKTVLKNIKNHREHPDSEGIVCP